MFVQLTVFRFVPERMREGKKIYNELIAPIIKNQKGNLNACLLEPVDKSDDYIFIRKWKTRFDAESFESKGTYRKMITKLDGCFAKHPESRTYHSEEIRAFVDSL